MKNTLFPEKLGNYILQKSLGKGGMGEVFLAEDEVCKRPVALKKIRKELQKFPSIRSRFLREARIAAQLSHPSIIPIFSISDSPEYSFYTMPYIEGETLKQILKEGRHSEHKGSIPYLTRIFLAICQAIAYAHSKKILHRDLKPENVIVGKFGEVLILDWGLAQMVGEGDDLYLNLVKDQEIEKHFAYPHLTRPGKVVGTLAYLAPERALGNIATEQTDLYALGVILFQILTLKLPFKRGDLETFQKRWEMEEIPDPIETAPDRDIPHALAQMALKALSRDHHHRYPSIKHLIEELESFIEGKPDWVFSQNLSTQQKEDWEFQELILLAKHMAITRSTEMEWVHLMISKESFPENCRLETSIILEATSQGIGFLMGAPGPAERKSVIDGFCLWIGSTLTPGSTLYRNNIEVLSIPSVAMESGRLYAIRIEKNDHHLKLYIDNHLRLHYLSQTPLGGGHLGVIQRDTHLEIQPLKISLGSQNVMVSCLTLADTLLSFKEYDKALAEYRKIAISFPGRLEGREARFRAGTTLLQAAAQREELYEEALEEFGKLHGTAGAPLEYLGKSLVYQALKEWEEEAKCLELAVRKYPKHPLYPRIVEHVVFRLHESSSHQRLAAYHLTLLALRHLPEIFNNPDTQQILHQIQNQWVTLPYFPPNATAVQLAFLLDKPLTLMEMVETGAWVEESYFGLLELGVYELVRRDLQVKHYPAVLAAIEAIEKGHLPTKPVSRRLTMFLFYLLLERGQLQELNPSGMDLFYPLAQAIASRQFERATYLFEEIPLEQRSQETSPYFILFGCYLWALEGEEIAKAHFNAIEDMRYPPAHSLLAYYVMGKIDLTGPWFQEAFFWEKLTLYRHILLLAHALDNSVAIEEMTTRLNLLRLKA